MSTNLSALKATLAVFPSNHACPHCTRTFFLRKSLTSHLEAEHAPPRLPCPHGHREFLLRQSLDAHTAAEHPPASYVPSQSTGHTEQGILTRPRPAGLSKRIAEARAKRLTIADLRDVPGDGAFECPFCEQEVLYADWENLGAHVRAAHPGHDW